MVDWWVFLVRLTGERRSLELMVAIFAAAGFAAVAAVVDDPFG